MRTFDNYITFLDDLTKLDLPLWSTSEALL